MLQDFRLGLQAAVIWVLAVGRACRPGALSADTASALRTKHTSRFAPPPGI